jgi:hypothetical protein
MGNYSWFVSEENLHFRDEELFEYLAEAEGGGGWGDLLLAWYNSPTRKPYMSERLVLPKARHASGLPKLTFATLDGCRIAGYPDAEEGLRSTLDELAGFLAKPPKGGRGIARFRDDTGAEFSIVVDYRKATITLDVPTRGTGLDKEEFATMVKAALKKQGAESKAAKEKPVKATAAETVAAKTAKQTKKKATKTRARSRSAL